MDTNIITNHVVDPILTKFLSDVVTDVSGNMISEGIKAMASSLLNKWKRRARLVSREELEKEIVKDIANDQKLQRQLKSLPEFSRYKIQNGDIIISNTINNFPMSQELKKDKEEEEEAFVHNIHCAKVIPFGTYSVFEKGISDIEELFCVGVSMLPINSTMVPHDLTKLVKTKILMLSKHSILKQMCSDEAFSDISRYPKDKAARWVEVINSQYDDFLFWKGKKEFKNNVNLQIRVHKNIPFNGFTYIRRNTGMEEIYLSVYLNSLPGNNGPLIYLTRKSNTELFTKLYKAHDDLWNRSVDILKDKIEA